MNLEPQPPISEEATVDHSAITVILGGCSLVSAEDRTSL